MKSAMLSVIISLILALVHAQDMSVNPQSASRSRWNRLKDSAIPDKWRSQNRYKLAESSFDDNYYDTVSKPGVTGKVKQWSPFSRSKKRNSASHSSSDAIRAGSIKNIDKLDSEQWWDEVDTALDEADKVDKGTSWHHKARDWKVTKWLRQRGDLMKLKLIAKRKRSEQESFKTIDISENPIEKQGLWASLVKALKVAKDSSSKAIKKIKHTLVHKIIPYAEKRSAEDAKQSSK
jgi:hypothetical protein